MRLMGSPKTSFSDTVDVKTMSVSDVPTVGQLERRNYLFPWTDGIFRDCIRAGYRCFVLCHSSAIIGYTVLQIGYRESHVLNICIDAPWQGRGFARQLLQYLEGVSIAERAEMMFLEVRPSNPRARSLYERCGFNEISVRPNYYDGPKGREDAVGMAKTLVP